MSKEEKVHSKSHMVPVVGCFIALILACSIVTFAGYRFMQAWGEYDPKAAATARVIQCLEAGEEENQKLCGLITNFPCWNLIQEAKSKTRSQYQIDVLWYNWEDELPNRGGDEVYLQVTFTDGRAIKILWYEGTLESCEVNS
jgi:hypothetical protein